MRVTLFAPYDTQPYIWLYKKALERQGLAVHLEPEFNLSWLLTRGKSCDAIHLHWIDRVYRPSESNVRSGLARRLSNSLPIKSLHGALRLVGFSLALFLAKLWGKAIVYTVHEFSRLRVESRPFVILRRIIHWVIFSLADQIHVHNRYSCQVLEAVYKRRKGIQVIPIGNYAGCYPNEISRLDARRQLDLPEDAFVYLFLGWVRPNKGVEDLIVAFERLDLLDCRLMIVGRVSRACQKILSLGQNNAAIKLVPEFVPDETIQLYMNASDACVLPYKHITTSSAIMLAWTFGRPVIVPAIASFPEMVTLETGVLYDPSQPDALVSALYQARQRAWSEPEILGYAHRFDWDKLGPQLTGLYEAEHGR